MCSFNTNPKGVDGGPGTEDLGRLLCLCLHRCLYLCIYLYLYLYLSLSVYRYLYHDLDLPIRHR